MPAGHLCHEYRFYGCFSVFYTHQAVFKDIQDHEPTVSSVNRLAASHVQTKDPEEAKQIQTKLDLINERYAAVREATVDHGKTLNSLTDRLTDFERQVDEMEETVLPELKTLQSKEFMRNDIPVINNNLKVKRAHCET